MARIHSILRALVLQGIIFFVCSGFAFAWSADDYANNDYETFAELPEALERIDMKQIDYPLLQAAIFYETNRQRVLNKLPQFGHSEALERSAQGYSDDMVKLDFFSHTSPVKGKETVTKRLALVGIENAMAAENLAESFGIEYKAGKNIYSPAQNGGYFSYEYKGKPIKNHTYIGFAQEVLDQWMHSPGHRANILTRNLKFLGTGASHYTDKNFFDMDYFKCTQHFSNIEG